MRSEKEIDVVKIYYRKNYEDRGKFYYIFVILNLY